MEQIWLAGLLKSTVLLLHDHTSVSKNRGLAKHNAEKITKKCAAASTVKYLRCKTRKQNK